MGDLSLLTSLLCVPYLLPFSMVNNDFSVICKGHFSLQQINNIEIALLSALKYNCRVGLDSYAKYYFKLRRMLPNIHSEVR